MQFGGWREGWPVRGEDLTCGGELAFPTEGTGGFWGRGL